MLFQKVSERTAATGNGKLDLRSAAAVSGLIWLAYFGLSVISALGGGVTVEPMFQLARALIALVGFASCIAIHLVLPERRTEQFWSSLFTTLLLCVPVSAALTIYSYYQFDWLVGARKPKARLLYDFAFSFAYYLWIYVSWAALYSGLTAAHRMHERERRAAELETRAREAQLDALRYQLNPHFFFNVLNTLSGLVTRERLKEAELVIQNMADFLRYSLSGSPSEFVSLREEIAAQKKYLEIEKLRFGERLAIEMDIPAECEDAAVPPLILQPLVENSVKHGASRSEDAVPVVIQARCTSSSLICSVRNGPVRDAGSEMEGLGLGLENVRKRLHAIYGSRAHLLSGPTEEGGWHSELRLPMRRFNA